MLRAFRAVVLLALTGLPGVVLAQELRVAAGADLQPVLPRIAAEFERENHVYVGVTYGASGNLTAQIESGAPFDLFLAADMQYPARIVSAGLAVEPQPVLIAHGVLVFWARKDSALQPMTLASLRSEKLKRLAIANPKTAPYGRAAMSSLEKLDVLSGLKEKLVAAENVAQAAQFAESGNADAGLISLNAAANEPLASEGTYVAMPAESYPQIDQGAIVLRRAKDAKLARAFVDAVANAMLHAAQPQH